MNDSHFHMKMNNKLLQFQQVDFNKSSKILVMHVDIGFFAFISIFSVIPYLK